MRKERSIAKGGRRGSVAEQHHPSKSNEGTSKLRQEAEVPLPFPFDFLFHFISSHFILFFPFSLLPPSNFRFLTSPLHLFMYLICFCFLFDFVPPSPISHIFLIAISPASYLHHLSTFHFFFFFFLLRFFKLTFHRSNISCGGTAKESGKQLQKKKKTTKETNEKQQQDKKKNNRNHEQFGQEEH